MNENKPKVATWALCVDIDPDNPEMLTGELMDIKVNYSKDAK